MGQSFEEWNAADSQAAFDRGVPTSAMGGWTPNDASRATRSQSTSSSGLGGMLSGVFDAIGGAAGAFNTYQTARNAQAAGARQQAAADAARGHKLWDTSTTTIEGDQQNGISPWLIVGGGGLLLLVLLKR